ncbi:MAG: hypothetical protein QNJ90_14530 [Planctomycetota bacterium]|nr:hypothetical protein [Planctomycetota bacterium]
MSIVIGITGRNCAGKDTVAKALVARGFESHSLSDVLRAELRQRGQEITRPALIALGNELRAADGPGVLARRVHALMTTDRVALVSVRNPTEVETLRELPHFVLIGVDAPVAVRFARESSRGRESAPGTLEEFMALEERENTADPNAQQLDATMALADHVLMNDGSLADFEAKVSDLLTKLSAEAPTEQTQP